MSNTRMYKTGDNMKALVTIEPEKPQREERPVPVITEKQALVEVLYVGVCGSDVHIYYGKHPFVGPECYPLVQGHESVARVVKTGDAVKNVKEGDYITVMPQIFCGTCEMCRTGNIHICEKLEVLGCQRDGLLSTYFAVDANLLLKIEETDDLLAMTLIEPLAVAVGGVRKLGSIAGKRVLVYGAGVIGNLTAQVLKVAGAREVAIADLSKYRVDLAVNQCGIDTGINIPDVSPEDEAAVFGGFDAVMECVGVENTLRSAIINAKKNAKIIVMGVFGKETTIPMALVQDRELKIEGSLMYEEEDFTAAIDYIRKDAVNVRALIFDTYAFSDSEKVYEFIAGNKEKALKVIVDMKK